MHFPVRRSVRTEKSPSEESVHRRLLRLDSRVRNQFDLITSRTGWLLTSHAFLLAAFAAIVNTENGNTTSSGQDLLRHSMLIVLPFVGIVTSVIVLLSIRAAYGVIDDVKLHRGALLKIAASRFGYEDTEPATAHTWAGDLPPKVLPAIMFLIWSGVFVLSAVIVSMPPGSKCSLL